MLWTTLLFDRTLGGYRIEAPPDGPDEMFSSYYLLLLPRIYLQRQVREKFGFKVGEFPHFERISQRSVSLPFFTDMVEDEARLGCETLKRGLTEIT